MTAYEIKDNDTNKSLGVVFAISNAHAIQKSQMLLSIYKICGNDIKNVVAVELK